jgi:hypothetical protein
MSPLPARGPALERWWEREIDRRVARAVGLSDDLSNEAIAQHFRALVGLPPEGTTDPLLWPRYLYGIELARTGPAGPRGDQAEFANNVVEWAAPGFNQPDEVRFGYDAWDRELGVTDAKSDDILRELAYEELAPRLERAGLYALL